MQSLNLNLFTVNMELFLLHVYCSDADIFLFYNGHNLMITQYFS